MSKLVAEHFEAQLLRSLDLNVANKFHASGCVWELFENSVRAGDCVKTLAARRIMNSND